MMRSTRLLLLCLTIGLCLSCSKCQEKKQAAAGLTGLIPADVAGVVIVPDLAASLQDVNALTAKLAVGPAATFLNQAKLQLTRRLGYDPLDPKAWKKLGVDPSRGLAIVLDHGRELALVGISDRKTFETEVQQRLAALANAKLVSTTEVNGVKVTSLGNKVGDNVYAHLHYAFAGDYALLTGMAGDPALLAGCARLPAAGQLGQADWYERLAKKLPAKADLQVLVNGPRAKKMLERSDPELARIVDEGAALAFELAPDHTAFHAFWGGSPDVVQKLGQISVDVPDAHLEQKLPADTFMALKVRIDPAKLLATALQADPSARQDYERSFAFAKDTVGVDVEKATVHNLTGNAVAGLSLGKAAAINRVIASGGEQELESAVRVYLWAQLKDGAAFGAMLQKILDTAADKLPAEHSKEGPLTVLTFPGRRGMKVHLLHHGDLAGICLGDGCTGQAAALVAGKGKALPSRLSEGARKLFDAPSLLVGYFDFGQVVSALSGLDASAFGQGGMAVKMILDMALGAVKNLGELTGQLRIEPDGVAVQAHLRIQ